MARERMTTSQLRTVDLDHLWHPFTQTSVWRDDNAPIIERGDGMYLIDTDGRRYLDGVSSLWCNVHGHGVPELVRAIHAQVDTLCHSTLLGLSHRPVLELTERLRTVLPGHLSRIFYADSGSAAVEAALRMCVEWWHKSPKAAKPRSRILSLDTGYHGDTLGAVGVGYVESFHRSLRQSVVPSIRVPSPHPFRFEQLLSEEDALGRSIEVLQQAFRECGDELAACIIEPMVQGAAGIWTYPAAYLQEVERLCRRHGTLLICDEVATGFGKTGRMFAHELASVRPDVMIAGKGLTAGYLPLSAVAVTEDIFAGFTAPPEQLKTFYYGQTYAGNPVAAAAGIASLDLFASTGLLTSLQARLPRFHQLLDEQIGTLAHVDEVRKLGVMVGIELTKTPGARAPYDTADQAGIRIVREAWRRGVIIRPLGNVMVLMPAPAMEVRQLERLVSVTADSIREVLGER